MKHFRLAVLLSVLCIMPLCQMAAISAAIAQSTEPTQPSDAIGAPPATPTPEPRTATTFTPRTALDHVIQGRTLRTQGRLNEAIAAYRRAIELNPNLAVAYNNLGIALAQQGRLQEAVDAYRNAIRLDQNLASAYNNLGMALNELGRPGEAREIYNQARAIISQSSSINVLDYINLGRALANQGRHDEAIEAYQQGIDLNPKLGTIYNNLGNSYRSLERLDDAEAAYRKAIELTPSLVVAYNNLGYVLTQLNRIDEARAIYDQANAIDPRLVALRDPASATAEDYNTLGRVLRSQNRREEAIQAYNRAIELNSNFAAAYNNRGVALTELASLPDHQGDSDRLLDEAIENYKIATQLDPTPVQFINLGNALRSRGRSDEAIEAYLGMQAVLDLIEKMPARPENRDLLTALLSEQRNFDFYRDRAFFYAQNQSYYDQYIDLLMQLHREKPDSGFDLLALQTSERARARSLLEILTDAEAYQNVNPQLAEEERRLRHQFTRLETQWSRIRDEEQRLTAQQQVVPDEVSDPNQALQTEFELGEQQHRLEDRQVEIEQQINQLLESYTAIQDQIREENPNYAEMTQPPPPLTVQDIQQQVLDRNTLLLEYWLGENRSYLWLVSDQGISTYELPGRATLDEAARRFYDHLTIPSERIKIIQTAKAGMELSRMILGPVANQLGNKRLLVVASGSLHYIPFSALPIPQATNASITSQNLPDPLVVRNEIVNLPSASALALIRQRLSDRQPAPEELAIIADPVFNREDERFISLAGEPSSSPTPDQTRASSETELSRFARLLGTSQEANEIVRIAQSEGENTLLASGFDANLDLVSSDQLENYRILHFATHGFLNDRNPGQSGLVLSQFDKDLKPRTDSGFLSLTDVFNLYLPADLVVLSGCRTGLGANLRGEGLVGLTQGFMYAGAERVVVSLWSVDDEATAALMGRFYRELLDRNKTPAEALRAAQIYMLNDRDSRWQIPYYWAAFTVQGEWK